MKMKITIITGFLLLLLSACSANQMGDMEGMDHSSTNKEKTGQNDETSQGTQNLSSTKAPAILKGENNEFTITAKEAKHQLTGDVSLTAWTFNGSVPGDQIRIKQGEEVKIKLINTLPDPVTIHWHGITVKNNMDGIPGITQNAVQPGESFVYSFTPKDAGTYMYHTHQDGVKQMDKGLAGSLIVEPVQPEKLDKDFTLVLDEWMSDGDSSSMMEGMNMSMESNEEENPMSHSMDGYDIYTINGKSGKAIEPFKVKEGDKVRIRLVNVGFMSHSFHLHGHEVKVVAIDGQSVNQPKGFKDELVSIAPGERYDLEFTADNPGEWYLESHGNKEGTKGMRTKIQYEQPAENSDQPNSTANLPIFDYTTYGKSKEASFTLDQTYDLDYTMNLNTEMKEHKMVYTINDKVFPETENIQVEEGDLVKVRLKNDSMADDHPMHLHGHFFQILSKNGKPLTGSPVIKDTVNVKPGDEYVIAFKADNPGDWLFHCHDLHHASAGMMNMVEYKGFTPDFEVDPQAQNSPH
ncbi:multicopper oxidase family protein [Rossellomorea vietnamensis]|uniref:multicopper oxidase family protein n=1 Tax=Rossellomorea vietnamensis TaxID=218284 RepID=UPI00077C62C2|nr:multicopper oxidase family protein [Rossellomorea vietnamensis]